MKLKDKNVLITGGSRGLGFVCAKEARAEGANIIIMARTESTLRAAHDELLAMEGHGTVAAICADVMDILQYGTQRVLGECRSGSIGESRYAPLHALIHCAGVYGPMDKLIWMNDDSLKKWEEAIRINLIGTMRVCRAVVPEMVTQGYGRIVILSGGGATKPMPHFTAYSASKAGVVRFAESLAEEVKENGVTVNCVAPGALNTEMLDEVLTAGPERVGADFHRKSVEQKAMGGDSLEEAAKLCIALCTDDAKEITGRLISAKWDEWNPIQWFAKGIVGTEHGMLRRVTRFFNAVHSFDENMFQRVSIEH